MEFPLLKELKDTEEICPKHNIPLVQLRETTQFCTECQKEKIQADESKRVENAEERHYRRRTVETLEKDSLVGDPLLWGASFENYQTDNEETTKALELSKVFAAEYLNPEKNFNTIFSGVPGAGKSHLAMSILKMVNENANPLMSCLFISVNDLMRVIKDSISNKESKYTEDNMIRLLTKADLLVLDDLGSESSFKRETTESSEYNQKILFAILNARSRTIITTNLSSEELRAIYNPKIISRIFRGVEGHIIKFTSETKDKRAKIQF